MQERRAANAPAAAPAGRDPDGVAVYRCGMYLLLHEGDDESAPTECGTQTEVRPYDPVPFHHGYAMHLVGYDWERDSA